MSEKKGKLFVISGPSGVGKDSVIEKAEELGLCFGQVITTTSRKPRGEEREGKPYHFVTQQQFEKLIKEKKLLEWAEVYGHYYGNKKEEVEEALKKYEVVILKVDPQGARTIKHLMPEAKVIFLIPPSLKELEKRLYLRKTDSETVIKKRLATAKKELKRLKEWNYVVVNKEGKLKETALEIKKIIERSSEKMVGRKILYGFFSIIILVGYFLVFGYSHPKTKLFVQNISQNVLTPLIIQKRIYQSQAILNFIPSSFSWAYFGKPVKSENIPVLDSIFSIDNKRDWLVFPEALVFYQKNIPGAGIVFRLANPQDENWEKFQDAIKYIWAFKFPFKKPKILSDGTKVLELVAQEEKVIPNQLNYEGTEIKILQAQNSKLAFARFNEFIILAESSGIVQSAIFAQKNPDQRVNLKNSTLCIGEEPYELTLFSSSDEKDISIKEDLISSLIFGQNKSKNNHCF